MAVVPLRALAQWTNQSITLRPGWNTVFLEIQPEPRALDALLAGRPVESVWMWNRRFSTVQFISDASALLPNDPDWLTWLPSSSPSRSVISLYSLLGGRPYLIKVDTNAVQFSITLRGRPVLRKFEWLSDSFNFVGFPVDAVSPPTFQNFFAPSPAHAGNPIYRLLTDGRWSQVIAGTAMQPGEAFWIRCSGQSLYRGPLAITLEQSSGLDYDRSLLEQTVRIKNVASNSRTFVVRQLASMNPSDGDYPALAGAVPLSFWRMDFATTTFAFVPMTIPLTNTLPAGAEWTLRLAVRRADMNPFTPPAGISGVLYQSLLEVRDSAGVRLLIPVSAKGLQTYLSSAGGGGFSSASAPSSKRAGLWVGSAVINRVNQPAGVGDPSAPLPTASEFQFRLLVHVNNAGQAALLQKVSLMWKDGAYTNNAEGRSVLAQDGRYVLVTDDGLLANFKGAALRDGEQVGRRFSSTAFGFKNPIGMGNSGEFGASNSVFGCSVPLEYQDSLNPFKHKYHPDHDNLDARFQLAETNRFADGVESFTVNRQILLQFTSADPERLALPGWGDTQLGGIYRETLTGLHKDPLNIEGTFRLHRASPVGSLNDAP